MDMDNLFDVTAPPSRTTFVADPVPIVKNKIQEDCVAPNAVDTPDPSAVAPLWARCSFLISAGHQCPNRRLALVTLREAMQHAIAHDLMHELKIAVGLQALHFQPGSNCPQWGTDVADSSTGFVAPAALAAPPAPAAAAPAAAPGPAPPTPADVATAVATAVAAAIRSVPTPPITVTAVATPSATRLRMLFNPASLPADV